MYQKKRLSKSLTIITVLIIMVTMVLAGCSQSAPAGKDQSKAEAPKFPSKTIEMVVPFNPGGMTDIVARSVAAALQRHWGQTVNVVNQAGGSGTVAMVELLSANPDGYKVIMGAASTGSLNAAVQKDIPYKWDGYTFPGRIARSPLAFVVKGDSKWNTLQDVIADVKQDPSKYNYGSSGPGGPSTFAIAQIMNGAGIDPSKMEAVVFGGGAKTVTAVAGGDVDFCVQMVSEALTLAEAGKVKIIAVSGNERLKNLPDVPTSKESGFAEMSLEGWSGITAPPNTPDDVIKEWEKALEAISKDQTLIEELAKANVVVAYQNSGDFTSWLNSYFNQALEIAEQVGLRK